MYKSGQMDFFLQVFCKRPKHVTVTVNVPLLTLLCWDLSVSMNAVEDIQFSFTTCQEDLLISFP